MALALRASIRASDWRICQETDTRLARRIIQDRSDAQRQYRALGNESELADPHEKDSLFNLTSD